MTDPPWPDPPMEFASDGTLRERGDAVSGGWLRDPGTQDELPAMPGEITPERNTAAHWRIERDESGMPVRMWFAFCDDPACCPEFPTR